MCVDPKNCRRTQPEAIFSIHGLWPSVSGQKGGSMPPCNQGDEIRITENNFEEDFLNEMTTHWPSLSRTNSEFWTHEYNRHGFCYMTKFKKQNPQDYFEFAMHLYKKYEFEQLIHSIEGETDGESIIFQSPQELKQKLQIATGHLHFDLHCHKINGIQYLIEIRFYFDLDLHSYDGYESQDCSYGQVVLPLNL